MRNIFSILLIFSLQSPAFAADDEPAKKSECERLMADAEALAQSHREADAKLVEALQNIPRENQGARLDGYESQNDTQESAKTLVSKWIDYEGPKSIGLVLSGTPGLGKTHLAVSAARAASEIGARVLFVTPETIASARSVATRPLAEVDLMKFDVIILDDLNRDNERYFHSYKDLFITAVHWAHRHLGKKILVTSNSELALIIRRAFAATPDEASRFEDRIRTMFKDVTLTGPSNRPNADWTD